MQAKYCILVDGFSSVGALQLHSWKPGFDSYHPRKLSGLVAKSYNLAIGGQGNVQMVLVT